MSAAEKPSASEPRRSPRILAAAVLAPAALVAASLYAGVATSGGATCPSRWLFHSPCAGCGMTRAFAALFHGDVAYALRANVASPALFAIALGVGLVFVAQLATNRPIYRELASRRWVRVSLSVALIALALIAWVSNQMRHRAGEGPLRLRSWHQERNRPPLADLPGGES
jgi:hypothetical protein